MGGISELAQVVKDALTQNCDSIDAILEILQDTLLYVEKLEARVAALEDAARDSW